MTETKIGYFGDAFCRPRSKKPVRTFVDIVNMHYGRDIKTVCVGRANGTDLIKILEDIERTDHDHGMDMAMVFHEPDRDRDPRIYQSRQHSIDSWFLEHSDIKVLHLIDPDADNIQFRSGDTDLDIMNYVKWTRHYRVAASYEDSDNGVDQVGNWRAATRLIEFIDQNLKPLSPSSYRP
jgi:hypothetical protein